jgi:hypothetical protein
LKVAKLTVFILSLFLGVVIPGAGFAVERDITEILNPSLSSAGELAPESCGPPTVEQLHLQLETNQRAMEVLYSAYRIQIQIAEVSGQSTQELREALAEALAGYETANNELRTMILELQLVAPPPSSPVQDPFSMNNCLKGGYCKKVRVFCLTLQEIQEKVKGAAGAACDRGKCQLLLTKDMCKLYGIKDLPEGVELDPGAIQVPRPRGQTIHSGDIINKCVVQHELRHAGDDPRKCPNCGSEKQAYDVSAKCYAEEYARVGCNSGQILNPSHAKYCEMLKRLIQEEIKAGEFNQCLCRFRVPPNNALYKKGACEKCKSETLGGLDSDDQNDIVDLYCKGREVSAP